MLKVYPLSLTTFRNSLLDQLNSDNEKYDVTEAIANLDDTCNKLESLQSMLKVLSDEDEIGNTRPLFSDFTDNQFNNKLAQHDFQKRR